MKQNIFKNPNWWWRKYDGRRKKYFLNLTKDEFEKAKEKRIHREYIKLFSQPEENRLEKIKQWIEIFSTIPYEYEGDGWDDFNKYQRPCSNGIGYVAICPGERYNNIYVDDPILVKILIKKYNNYWNQKQHNEQTI